MLKKKYKNYKPITTFYKLKYFNWKLIKMNFRRSYQFKKENFKEK